MSHPIDEIFRKGLSDAEFEGHDRSWQDAKELLRLKKPRKRRFMWLLFFAAIGLGLGTYAWMSMHKQDNIEVVEPYLADTVKEKRPASHESSFSSTDDRIMNWRVKVT